ncbi:CHAT domain-containing protein [Scytonema sp. UIC 10036]|uniref:CHAT domain-containing protein n=1 Tax=Scytonema sp. UIC 10036 TaxID=2304196 RepID=UPI0012DAE399|nr:CHAT domain-containing protein [Scytonema sp. UIC 10036]MUG95313.1 CHAT domain-containing protein [Scytonema sp. UIC 10036]
MLKFYLLGVAVATVTSSFAVVADAANYPKTEQSQRTQVVQGNTGQLQQGLQLYQQEQFSQAVQVLEQAALQFQSQGDILNQALALNYVALAYQKLGQLPQASTTITNSLNLLLKNGINSKEYISVRAQALNTQGQIQIAQGKPEGALASWEEATALYVKNRDSEGEIGSQLNQAQALQVLGLYRRALITLKDVNQLLQQQPNSLLKANGLLSLGNALRVVGVLDQKNSQANSIENLGSLQALQQSLAVASQLNSPELVAEIYLSLGNTAQALQKTDEAMQYYQQAAASSVSPMTRLSAQMNQLRLSVQEAQYTKIAQILPEIQSQLDTLPPSRKTVYAKIHLAQSLACLKQGTEARGTAVNLFCPQQQTKVQATTTNGTPEWAAIAQILVTAVEQARSLKDTRAEAYALGTLGGLYEQTQQWSNAQTLTQQAVVLAEGISAQDIGYRWQWQLGRILKARKNEKGAIAAYTKAVANLKSLRSDLAAMNRDVQFSFQEQVEPVFRELVSLLLQSQDNNPSQDALATARNVLESLQLAELDNFFRRACIDAKPVQIDEVDRTAAVIYPVILSDRLEVILSLPSSSTNQKSQQILRRYTVPLRQAQIEDTIDQLRQTLEIRTTEEFKPLSQQVYEWIIQPLAPELEKRQVKNLVFVLDGVLRSIPMAALHDKQKYLIEKYNVATTPGLQLLNPQPLARTQLRTIAGGLSEGSGDFPPLPAVKDELDEIKSTVRQSQVLLNEEFTRNAIENAVKSLDAPVVHLATHGQFSSRAEDTFFLTYDGKVNINELSNLLKTRETNQQGAIELLVLSACSTAAGDKRAALGIAGVAVQAGARSTLASLWVVEDEATALIMGEFYQQLNQPNISKAEAFKNAQLKLLKNRDRFYEHPYYWAPFILVGNWL